MQTNNAVIGQELDSFSSKGSTDAKLRQEVNVDKGVIKPAARTIYNKIKAKYAGASEKAKMQYEQTESRINDLLTELKTVKENLNGRKIMSFLRLTFYYTLPGWLYVIGDVMFSMELIVKGWGLGQQNAIERYSLAIAIGLAPFFVKHIIDRFFEPSLEKGSPQLKKLMTAVYIGLGVLMVFSFCQIAYVRNIFFRYMKTDSGAVDNVYDILFANHGATVAWSFILVALMFVIGGGFLLSISAREFSKRGAYKKLVKLENNLKIEIETEKEKLAELKCEHVEAKEMFSEWSNKEESIEQIENELKYAYLNGFQEELSKMNDDSSSKFSIDEIVGGVNNFHDFARQLVDHHSVNKKGSKYNA